MTIDFNEIDTTSLMPGVFAEHDLIAGAPGVSGSERKVYILGERVSGGTSTDNEVSSAPFVSWAEANAWFGAGSIGSWMAAIAMREMQSKTGRKPPIYGCALPDAGGTASKGTFTVVGVASSAGYATCRIGDLVWITPIDNGSTAQQTAEAIAAKYATLDDWEKPPITISTATGTDWDMIITANNTGAHLNQLQIEVVAFTPGTQTLAVDAATLGTTQAGVGDVTLTTALTNLAAIRTHYICFSDFITGTSTTGLTALKNHLKTKADGNNMLGGFLFIGHDGTLSAASTVAAAVDSKDAERVIICWSENSKSWAPALGIKAMMDKAMQNDPTYPINGVTSSVLMAQPASDRPTDTECNTALAAGLTPIRTPNTDEITPAIVKLVSMRTDLIEPFSPEIIETLDEFRDRALARCRIRFANFKIKENSEQIHSAKCTTPEGVSTQWKVTALEMHEEDKLQNVIGNLANVIATFVPPGSVEIEMPATWVPGLDRILTKIKAVYP